MNFRTTAIFFGLGVFLVAVLLAIVLIDDTKDAPETDSLLGTLAKQGVTEKDVTSVELIRTDPGEEKLLFVKDPDGRWEIAHPFKGKADGFAVEGIVRDLFRAKPIRYKDLTDNLTLHGLDKPTLRVTVRAGGEADREATVNIGTTVIGADSPVTFVTTSAAPKTPLAVRRNDLTALFREGAARKDGPAWETAKWLAEYRLRQLLGGASHQPELDTQAVKITTGGKEVALSRGAKNVWKFDNPPNFGIADDLGETEPQAAAAAITGVRPLLNVLTNFRPVAEDFIDKPGDLKQYGLTDDNPNLIRIELKPRTGPPEVLFLGGAVKEQDKPVVPSRVYARLEGDPSVVKLQTDRVEAIRQTALNPNPLRNRDLLSPERREHIDAIDVTVGGATTKLRKVTTGLGDQWVLYDGPTPAEAKRADVTDLLTTLARPRAAREVLTAPNDAAFTPAETKAVIKVWFSGVEQPKAELGKTPPEPKLKGDPVELTFGKREGTDVFVRRKEGGAVTDLKLPDSALPLVTKSRLDYLDVRPKSFVVTLANKLTFNRGAEVLELTREPATAPSWKMKGKAVDDARVAGLAGLLAMLAPERVVSENPSPDDLKKWNLDPMAPRMRVTVGLPDPNDKERVYLFGADTEDKKSVYAQQVGKPHVFTVRRDVLDRFLTEDLRDRVVYRLAPANMKKVTLEGWAALNQQLSGKPERMKYVLERGPDGWKGTTPAGFAPDNAKVVGLLNAIASPRAGDYLPGKPEHGTDPATNPDAFVFTIESEGGPTVILVLGKPAAEGRVYAASSVMPGESFTLDTAEIRKYTERPASLQK